MQFIQPTNTNLASSVHAISRLHDIYEEPRMGKYIMAFFKRGGYASWLVSPEIEEDFKEFNVIKWAYIDDVIRNMEKYYND